MRRARKVISFDVETTGFDRLTERVFSYSVCDESGQIGVHRLDGDLIRRRNNHERLESIWNDTSIVKVMHNAKFDLGFMIQMMPMISRRSTRIHDTMLMSRLLQNDAQSHGLKQLCWELGGYPKDDEAEVKGYTHGEKGYEKVPEHIMGRYQERDAERCMLLYKLFWPELEKDPVLKAVYENELEVVWTAIRMENRGVMLSKERCRVLIEELKEKVEAALDELKSLAGVRIVPSKSKHIHWLLFQKLGLPILEQTNTGKASTKKTVMLELRKRHPSRELDLVLMFRSYSHGISVINGYLDHADGYGIIHPRINTCEARTGRESCSEPNLQNVAKSKVLLNPFPVPARRVFRPRPQHVNIHVDYSSIEMRLAVHYSGDEVMTEELRQGRDVHLIGTRIAYPDYDDLPSDHQKVLRSASKNANFAVLYGASPAKWASTCGLDVNDESMKRYELLKSTCPRFIGLIRKVSRDVKIRGYVRTMFGRLLHVPRDHAFVGVNYLIQGSAADIMKRGKVRVDNWLHSTTGDKAQIILSIHDELVIEFSRKLMPQLQSILSKCRELMISFNELKVPLDVDFQIATFSWEHGKELKVDPEV